MKNFFVLGIVFFMALAFITGCERVSSPARDIIMAPEVQGEVLEQIQTLLQHPKFQDEDRVVTNYPLGNNDYLLGVGMPNANDGTGTVHIFGVNQNGAYSTAEISPNDHEALKFGRIVLMVEDAGDIEILIYFKKAGEDEIYREPFFNYDEDRW